MNTETIQTAATVLAPIGDNYFRGTLSEATDAVVKYAAETRADYGGGATSDLIKRLRNSDPDRVAEIAAVALLNLAAVSAEARPTLTRADKERAVKELASRLSGVSENFAHAQTHPGDFRAGAAAYFNRRQGTLRAALVRLAMARTAD